MRNIALGRCSTTRPSTSMAPSFLAILSGDPCFRLVSCLLVDVPVKGQPWLRLRNVSQWVEIPRHAKSRRGSRTVHPRYPFCSPAPKPPGPALRRELVTEAAGKKEVAAPRYGHT